MPRTEGIENLLLARIGHHFHLTEDRTRHSTPPDIQQGSRRRSLNLLVLVLQQSRQKRFRFRTTTITKLGQNLLDGLQALGSIPVGQGIVGFPFPIPAWKQILQPFDGRAQGSQFRPRFASRRGGTVDADQFLPHRSCFLEVPHLAQAIAGVILALSDQIVITEVTIDPVKLIESPIPLESVLKTMPQAV